MTEFTAFIQRLNRTKPLSIKIGDALLEGMRRNRFDAQETFVSPGNYAASVYYVYSGIVRGAIEGTHEKVSTWFKQEGDIILPQGVFNQQASEEYISAVAKTTLLSLPIKHIQKVTESYPEINELMILLSSEKLNDGQYRERLLRIPAARERYEFLATHEDFILKRIPHYLVASYLNVTKETFSRLHKGLPY